MIKKCLSQRKNFEKLTLSAIRCYKSWGEELSKQKWWTKSHANRYALLCRMEKEFGQKNYLKKSLTQD
jgi:hypothetical protein